MAKLTNQLYDYVGNSFYPLKVYLLSLIWMKPSEKGREQESEKRKRIHRMVHAICGYAYLPIPLHLSEIGNSNTSNLSTGIRPTADDASATMTGPRNKVEYIFV